MAVFQIVRDKCYTVMSNRHLRNKELTLKAKDLFPQMQSSPQCARRREKLRKMKKRLLP